MLKILSTALIILTGCASAVPTPVHHELPRIKEPDRTTFYAMCIMQQMPITACACFEEVIVKMKGTDMEEYSNLDVSVAQQKCMEVLKPVLQEEFKEVLEEQLRKQQLKDRI
jgi:hypothetical protein